MTLSSSNNKKILIFSQKKAFLIFSQKKAFLIFSQKKAFFTFSEMEPRTFLARFQIIKNSPTRENLFCFRKRKPPKNFLYFFQKTLFLYFGKRNFPSSKNEKKPLLKCFLYFRKQKFSTPSL